MITTAYKSEHTGQLFETESEYNVHLEHHKRKEIELQKKRDLVSRTQNLIQQPRLTATSIEDFRQKAFEAINKINEFNKTKLLGLFFNNYRFCSVGNSHSKPIDGLSYYDGGNKEILYDGWYGHIVIVYEKDKGSDDLRRLVEQFPGINTGSGGYNSDQYNDLKGYVLSYELKLYLDDFPLIKERHEKYNQIKSRYNKWYSETEELISVKNIEDEIIIDCNNNIKKIYEGINELNKKSWYFNSKLLNKQLENKNIVLEENKFGELEEMEMIEKELKITNKWKIN